MKWVLGVSLAFGVPVVLIVGGIVWGPLMDWDLTQPQATLIAGFVAGPGVASDTSRSFGWMA
ncbi:hypothetical protein [Rhodococcus sp. KRD175]|uniref:hypothetical protein n=1 Tax=Rhodococcus sp. KRD175 TaxID=2729729 RepID=UPI0019D13076|nr:hypothetical protein [Rhodococcus sp. KRD175]